MFFIVFGMFFRSFFASGDLGVVGVDEVFFGIWVSSLGRKR